MPSSSKEHKTLPRTLCYPRPPPASANPYSPPASPLLPTQEPFPTKDRSPRSHTCLVLHLDMKPRDARLVPNLPCAPENIGFAARAAFVTTRLPRARKHPHGHPVMSLPPQTKTGTRHTGRNKVFSGLEGVRGRKGQFLPKNAPFSPVKTSRSPLPKLPAAHAPARRPQWRAARHPCPPQPCGRRCGRRPGAPPG